MKKLFLLCFLVVFSSEAQQPGFGSYNQAGGSASSVTNVVTGLAPQPMPSATPVTGQAAVLPLASDILGLSFNSSNAPASLWWSYASLLAGQWSGSFQLNGLNTLGSDTNMPLSGVSCQTFYVNGNTAYMTTNTTGNGGTLGAEAGVLISGRDPKQGTYLSFNAPKSGSGATMVMGSGVDFAVGLAGWTYGSNTLGGAAIGYDTLWAINPPCNVHFTTTGYNGNGFGCADFLGYDSVNFVWHWPLPINGNGCFGNNGYVDGMTFDGKNRFLSLSNVVFNAYTNVNFWGPVDFNGNSEGFNGVVYQSGFNGGGGDIGVQWASSHAGTGPLGQFGFNTGFGFRQSSQQLYSIPNGSAIWFPNSGTVVVSNNVVIPGSLSYQTTNEVKTANYSALAIESGAWFNNNGAVATNVITLPAATVGLHYTCVVMAAQTTGFKAVGSDTVRSQTSVSAAAGGVTCSVIGNVIHIFCPVAGKWLCDDVMGTWVIN